MEWAYIIQIFLGITFIAGVIALIIILRIFNKNLQKKVDREDQKYKDFKEKIEKIKESGDKTEKRFKSFNSVVRDFFKEYFDLGYTLTYLQLKEKFDKIEKKKYSRFCELMAALDYSRDSIEDSELVELVDFFIEMIDKRD